MGVNNFYEFRSITSQEWHEDAAVYGIKAGFPYQALHYMVWFDRRPKIFRISYFRELFQYSVVARSNGSTKFYEILF